MSKVTAALEVAVAAVIENTARDGERQSARQRANIDRAFASILKLIAPRIRHFIRQYGLTAHWDDAEQCCAIAVHRAIQAYEPDKAQFTTFVNWQIRGELQSLRFRLMTDQRPSAKKVEATTVSLNAAALGPDGEEMGLENLLVDEDAERLVESGAADYLAKQATAALIDEFVRNDRKTAMESLRRQQPKRALARARVEGPRLKSALVGIDPVEIAKIEDKLERDRGILEKRVFGDTEVAELEDTGVTSERVRQIGKRASRIMGELASEQDRFRIMADYGVPSVAARAKSDRAPIQVKLPIEPEPQIMVVPMADGRAAKPQLQMPLPPMRPQTPEPRHLAA